MKLGHHVVIATGRSYRASRVFYEKLKLNSLMINLNGGLIHHPLNKEFVKKEQLIKFGDAIDIYLNNTAHIDNFFAEHDERYHVLRDDRMRSLIQPDFEDGKIIEGLLRDKLSYEGLVISDCFEMDALLRAFSLEEAAIFAVKATVDLIVISHTFGRQLKVRNGLINAVLNGDLLESEIDKRLEHILEYKNKYISSVNNRVIKLKEDQRIADKISLESITTVSGKQFKIDSNTVVIGVTNYLNSIAEDENVEKMDVAEIIGQVFNIKYKSIDNKNFNVNKISEFAQGKKVILALADSHLTLVQKVLYAQLINQTSDLMLISLRTPYDILEQNLPTCHIAIYEYTEQSINSLIKVLKGSETKGVLPVNLEVKTRNQKEYNDINNQLVRKALNYLEANYSKNISLADLSETLLVSEAHISRLITKHTNETFIQNLTKIRINQAKHLLSTSNLKVYEASNLVGYVDVNHFSKTFKKIMGLTPIDYRNKTT